MIPMQFVRFIKTGLHAWGRQTPPWRVFARRAAHSLPALALFGIGLLFSSQWVGAQATANRAPLPDLGDSSEMSPAAERLLGDRIARELYRDPDYVDDPIIQDYVEDIWHALIAASRARGELTDTLYDAYAWTILTGRDRTVNAFALPGGYFGLHLGLVGIVTTRDELASVLAHELSHVTQRHISRSMARQSAQAPWLLGAMILGAVAASRNVGGGEALMVGGQAASAQSQLNYSRDMEREADRIGYNVSTQAGFAPQGFVSMFEKLQQANRLNDSGGFPYLRTHPLTTERMADMQTRVHQSGVSEGGNVTTPEHAMVAARARVLSASDIDALRLWQKQAESSNLARQSAAQQLGVLYGATLAAVQSHDFARAEANWVRLQAQSIKDVRAQQLVRLLAVEMALAQNQIARAQSLSQGLDLGRRPGLLLWAQAAILGDQASVAEQSLRSWLADHPRDAPAWQLLSGASNVLGHPLAAVRAEAEADVALLNYSAAAQRLRAAQDLARKRESDVDQIEASIVDTRARQIQILLKQQATEH